MFGQRDKRVARRQRTLEELLWLDPVERERRIIAAVAAGDFTADEVDASLRLVMRLDKLREMDLPSSGRLIGASDSKHAAVSSDDVELGLLGESADEETPDAEVDAEVEESELVAIPIVAEPIELSVEPEYVGIPVVTEMRPESSAEMPLDALESAERPHHRGHHAPAPSAIARRAAETRAEWNVPAEAAPLAAAEEVGPSISWLRPN